MVFEGILQDQVTAGWRPAAGEPFPTSDTNELVVFKSYFIRGFGIPAHPFLRKLLGYYGINLCHLHPNNILHISLFSNLCQAFIRIAPHFNLFRYFQSCWWSLSVAKGWHGEGIHTSASQHVIEGVECEVVLYLKC